MLVDSITNTAKMEADEYHPISSFYNAEIIEPPSLHKPSLSENQPSPC